MSPASYRTAPPRVCSNNCSRAVLIAQHPFQWRFSSKAWHGYALPVPGVQMLQVEESDVPVVQRLLDGARAWLSSRGIAQWEAPFRPEEFHQAANEGRLFLAVDDNGQPVGSLQLSFQGGDTWEEHPGRAVYVHRLVVSRSASGMGVAGQMLEWARKQGATKGLDHLRLVCNEYNKKLVEHYKLLGFTAVGHSKLQRTTDGVIMPVVLLEQDV